jgi:O-antigen/teichoic acid export membrane protein
MKVRIPEVKVYSSFISLLLAGAIYGLATSRILGASERGTVVAILSASSLAGLLGTAGSASEFRRHVAVGSSISIWRPLSLTLMISSLLGAVFSLVLSFLGGSTILVSDMLLLTVLSTISSVIFFLREVLAGANKISVGNWMLAGGLSLQIPILILLSGNGLLSVTSTLSLFLVAQVMVLSGLLVVWQGVSKRLNFSAPVMLERLIVGHRWSLVPILVAQYFSGGDRFVAALVIASDQVAFLAAASTMVLAPSALLTAMIPRIQNKYSQGIKQNRSKLLYLVVLIMAINVFIATFAYPLMGAIFGPEFFVAGSVVRIMSIGVPMFLLYQLFIASLMGRGAYGRAAMVSAATAVSYFSGMVILSEYGANGAAVGFVVGNLVGVVFIVVTRFRQILLRNESVKSASM